MSWFASTKVLALRKCFSLVIVNVDISSDKQLFEVSFSLFGASIYFRLFIIVAKMFYLSELYEKRRCSRVENEAFYITIIAFL